MFSELWTRTQYLIAEMVAASTFWQYFGCIECCWLHHHEISICRVLPNSFPQCCTRLTEPGPELGIDLVTTHLQNKLLGTQEVQRSVISFYCLTIHFETKMILKIVSLTGSLKNRSIAEQPNQHMLRRGWGTMRIQMSLFRAAMLLTNESVAAWQVCGWMGFACWHHR